MQTGSSFFAVPTPPPLAHPPLLEHLLLERPLPLALPLLVVGLVALRLLLRSERRPAWGIPLASALAAAGPGVFLLAMFVHTPREHMAAATGSLVTAVATASTPSLERLLAPDCYLFSRFGFPGASRSGGMDRAAILEQVPRTIQQYPIAEHSILKIQSLTRGANLGTTQLLAKVVVQEGQAGYRIPVQSWWKVDLREDGDGQWRATSIEALTNPAGGG